MDAQKIAIQAVIKKSLSVIGMYNWLLDLYVLDFFVDNHWEKLPSSWRQCLDDMDPTDLGKIIYGLQTKHLVPLSLLALLKTIKCLSITREMRNYCKTGPMNVTTGCSDHPKLTKLFLKHVKLKKQHEVAVMADIVDQVSQTTGCRTVVDFGSGLGHLVRVLAYRHGIHAIGVEAQEQLTAQARKLDLELEYTASKHLKNDNLAKCRPTHYNVTLSGERHSTILTLPTAVHSHGLVGLHPCGDLGPSLLRRFVASEGAKFICVVGCCYMKLTGDGYPMSAYVTQQPGHQLSYTSREIACHAIEGYVDRLRNGNYEDLKVHAYRGALERLLTRDRPDLRHVPLRTVTRAHALSFRSYCESALGSVAGSVCVGPGLLRAEADLCQWRRVVTLYTLRLVLAPLVETLLLEDRLMYLIEHGLSCEIQPVFDPKISPRNHIIIGRRL